MTVRIGDQSFPDSEAIIVAAARGVSLHPAGTWEAPCALCGVVCQIDMRNHLWRERTGVRVVCLPCAAKNYPNMIVGTVNSKAITMQAAIRDGWLKP